MEGLPYNEFSEGEGGATLQPAVHVVDNYIASFP